jgi:squalene-hopene/tetraprenyl-beta-curcumene cyclase
MNVTPPVALERGIGFLLAKQDGDGLWRDFHTPAGEASEWPTGFIGTALCTAGVDGRTLDRVARALIARQHADGGWGYNESVPSDADSTACVLLFLALTGRRGDSCSRAASCLISHQRDENGGVATYREPGPIRRFMGVGWWMRFGGWCSPHLEVTATTGRALATLDRHTYNPHVDATWRYVRSRQSADGSWNSYWWNSPHYATLQAAELAQLSGDYHFVCRAAEWAVLTQDPDGGWSTPGSGTSAFATALCLQLLVHANASGRETRRAVSRLAALQDEDGSWPSHPIMRIPLPGDRDPDEKGRWRIHGGFIVADQHRTFTSAACVAALARHSDRTQNGLTGSRASSTVAAVEGGLQRA